MRIFIYVKDTQEILMFNRWTEDQPISIMLGITF